MARLNLLGNSLKSLKNVKTLPEQSVWGWGLERRVGGWGGRGRGGTRLTEVSLQILDMQPYSWVTVFCCGCVYRHDLASPSGAKIISNPVAVHDSNNQTNLFCLCADGQVYSLKQDPDKLVDFGSWAAVGSSKLPSDAGKFTQPAVRGEFHSEPILLGSCKGEIPTSDTALKQQHES